MAFTGCTGKGIAISSPSPLRNARQNTENRARRPRLEACCFDSGLSVTSDEDVPLDVELGDGGSVSELSQVGEAATWGVAVGMVVWVGVVGASAARFAATSRSTATASLARSG
jgi:hypothetical protein